MDIQKQNQEFVLGQSTRRDFIKKVGWGVGGALVGSSVLAACGADGETVVPDTTIGEVVPAAEITGDVSFWAWGAGLEGELIGKRIEYFKSKYPKVNVEWEPLAKNGYEEYPALLARMAAGDPPDVMRLLNFQPTQLVSQGSALLALDDYIAATPDFDASDFFDVGMRGSKVDGTTYAIPDNGEPYYIYYNSDAFKAAGLDDPQTLFQAGMWNEEAFTKSIDALTGKGGMKFGIAFEAWTYDNFCFMGGGTILDSSLKATIDQGASPAMLQYFADLVKNGKAPSPVVGGGAQLEAFRNGQAGMYLMGAWWGGSLDETPPGFKWNMTGLPSFNGVRGCKIEVGTLGISSQTKSPDAAWAFVKTLTDTTGMVTWSPVATPMRKSAIEPAGLNKVQWKLDHQAMLEAASFTPFTTKGNAVDVAVSAALDLMWAGKSSAADATKEAAKLITEALN